MLGMWAVFDISSFVHATYLTGDELLTRNINDIVNGTPLGKVPGVLVTVGAVTLVLSFIGYIAAAGERRHLLICYATILAIIVLLEIVAGFTVLASRNKARNVIKEAIKTTFNKYDHWHYKQDTKGITIMWDRIMTNFQCCGVDNYTDFKIIRDWHWSPQMKVPESCCISGDVLHNCTEHPTELNSNLNKGCYNFIVAEIKKYTAISILTATVLLFSQLMGSVLAFYLSQLHFVSKVKHLARYRQKRRWLTSWNICELRYIQHTVHLF
jgi:hypothetical protein